MLAADATVFEAAIGAGLISTGTTAVLNKAIFDQNPTMTSLVMSFVANAGTFLVVGKLALAARAAGVEAGLAEGTAEAAHAAGATDAAAPPVRQPGPSTSSASGGGGSTADTASRTRERVAL
jgi:hypothetical protein